MALTEEQVVRYSRQILLKEVGGVGQQKLVDAAVRLRGAGSALQVAAAYLAAGGVGVQPQDRPMEEGEEGFLIGADTVGKNAGAAMRMALHDLSRDALSPRNLAGVMGELPCGFPDPGPWLAIGWQGSTGVVLWRAKSACAACFEQNAAELTNGPSDARSVALGALAALCFERLILGLGELEPLGGRKLFKDGGVESFQLALCEAHAKR